MAFRKTLRLSNFDCYGAYGYRIIMVTAARKPAFRSTCAIEEGVRQLMIATGKHGFKVHAYCFMPDHLHLLLQGHQWSDLRRFAQFFKQLTGYAHKQATGEYLWQPSYWDRVLRGDEDLHDVSEYIWGNPVRAGIAVSWRDYFGSGPVPMPEWM